MDRLDLTFINRNIIDNIKQAYISNSSIHGFGLFAKVDIDKNDILCVLDGQVISWDKYNSITNNLSMHIQEPYVQYFFMEWNALSEDTLLVRSLRTKYSYINHSRTPNTKLLYHPIRVVAIKDIPKDEEITIDYTKEPLNYEYIKNHGSSYL